MSDFNYFRGFCVTEIKLKSMFICACHTQIRWFVAKLTEILGATAFVSALADALKK